MEHVKCAHCAAVVAMPPLDMGGSALTRLRCACCEQLLIREAFCQREEKPARRPTRRYLACEAGPEAKLFWRKKKLPPRRAPDKNRRQREERQAEVLKAMNPAPLTRQAADLLQEPKKRKRGTRFRPRPRNAKKQRQQQ
ncbi:hypothetical protein PF008_g29548 [Phytophthora fragariae]|uniref:Uncharacterized protein n=1 Tax=Phytophthora fragariae TaxID=53985 RepID=A0A6G0Q832_9STRA|nr:hypothetical protein PF008_g29548 [Phytophthora fragariae]